MTLEQRIEALEKAVASLTLPSAKSEELAKMMQDTVSEVIRNAQRPGGALHNNGSGKESAVWGVKTNPANGQLTGFN
ncbi:hypothetical protein [Pantoea sp. Marseille-Q5743]|uniref:hypothetical protein n=1 Tax=Pantoea sp. Marseille-Q5743 TaxID=2972776 RepID=UPI0021C88287|nr:hypothetical protein [Pantoea sp. Marseille-Q5743]